MYIFQALAVLHGFIYEFDCIIGIVIQRIVEEFIIFSYVSNVERKFYYNYNNIVNPI